MSKKKPARKEHVVSKDGMITTYPTLQEIKEKGTLKSILEKLIYKRKGH